MIGGSSRQLILREQPAPRERRAEARLFGRQTGSARIDAVDFGMEGQDD
jgi:hypothetical protein